MWDYFEGTEHYTGWKKFRGMSLLILVIFFPFILLGIFEAEVIVGFDSEGFPITLGYILVPVTYYFLLYKWAVYEKRARKRLYTLETLLDAIITDDEAEPIKFVTDRLRDGRKNIVQYDSILSKYAELVEENGPERRRLLSKDGLNCLRREADTFWKTD